MVGYYLKTVTMAAMVMSLSSSAFGCLEIKGTTFNWARHGNGEITTTDSGVQTCTGPVDEGDNNVGMSWVEIFFDSLICSLLFILI